MLTLSVNESLNIPLGWHTMTISTAIDGVHNGTRFIDLHFENVPKTVKCRLWSKVNEDSGEDYGIGNVFRYTDAGITDNGDNTITIDDNVSHLKGKTLNVLFYVKENGYTDAAPRIAPVTSHNFSESFVHKLKAKAEDWVSNKVTRPSTATEGEEVPF